MKKIYLLLFSVAICLNVEAQLKINEVLYDPSNTALEGDANGDGVYNQTQDEFIELVNTGSTDLNIHKYRIFDKVKSTGLKTRRHTIGNFSIPSNGVIVIFGGDSLGLTGNFGGALVVVDSGSAGLSMGNSDEIIIVEDSLGNVVDSLDTDALSNNPNESYTRNPDISGDYVQHASVTPGKLFSPGTKIDGQPFNTVLSINKGKETARFTVFPNPSSGDVFISSNAEEVVSVEVLDMCGRSVQKQANFKSNASFSNLPPGVFQVKMIFEKGSPVSQVVVVQ